MRPWDMSISCGNRLVYLRQCALCEQSVNTSRWTPVWTYQRQKQIAGLRNIVLEQENQVATTHNTNRGGWQSDDDLMDALLERTEVQRLRTMILSNVASYMLEVSTRACDSHDTHSQATTTCTLPRHEGRRCYRPVPRL